MVVPNCDCVKHIDYNELGREPVDALQRIAEDHLVLALDFSGINSCRVRRYAAQLAWNNWSLAVRISCVCPITTRERLFAQVTVLIVGIKKNGSSYDSSIISCSHASLTSALASESSPVKPASSDPTYTKSSSTVLVDRPKSPTGA